MLRTSSMPTMLRHPPLDLPPLDVSSRSRNESTHHVGSRPNDPIPFAEPLSPGPWKPLSLGARRLSRRKNMPTLDGCRSPFGGPVGEPDILKLPAVLIGRQRLGSEECMATPTPTPKGRRVGFSAPASRQNEAPGTPLDIPAPPMSAPPTKRERKLRQSTLSDHDKSSRSSRSSARSQTRSVFFADQEFGAATSPIKRSNRRHKTWASAVATPTDASTPSAFSSQGADSPNTSGPPTATNAMITDMFGWIRGGPIGSGSYGCVFKALDQQTGRLFAVKKAVVDEGCEEDRKYRERLEVELSICKDLRHPNIVACLGFACAELHFYIYLEYVAGGSMSSILQEFGPLNDDLLRQATSGLVEGLDYLHTRNPPVVHRDIKGANILVDLNFCVKLADFGCSKRSDVTTSFTTIGSIPWMAPEVIQQQDGYGRKADVWSLGCVVIEMATAEKPWGKNAFENVMYALRHIAMSESTPPLPEGEQLTACRDLISMCTRRDPDARPASSDLRHHAFVQRDFF
mmetsp:Transcript_70118/g.126357  ORF Transcript_70118/g.126357 Transcript_70118/m.126357 type:complete len:515 (+) Transcript_70118:213-1757(+)